MAERKQRPMNQVVSGMVPMGFGLRIGRDHRRYFTEPGKFGQLASVGGFSHRLRYDEDLHQPLDRLVERGNTVVVIV